SKWRTSIAPPRLSQRQQQQRPQPWTNPMTPQKRPTASDEHPGTKEQAEAGQVRRQRRPRPRRRPPPVPYIKDELFTSEIYKVEIQNLPKFVGFKT
ncbi:hypothetical protein CRUP_004448, partial [Coryphaenoides rupestris]